MDPEPDPDSPPDRTGGLDPALASAPPVEKGASFGRYQDLRFLGAGGMAAVYRAHDPTLGRSVALKLLRGDDPQLAERLLMEARAQARIQHEHVCRIYEAGVQDGRPYIAMQYVEGVTLKDLRASLTVEEKLKLVQEAAEAVHAAHRVGFVHRDLKPSNVMVERGEDGRFVPYVMDFGLAREAQAQGLTATGIVVGTPWYMSPEQARGDNQALDRRSDVYSLGATLYELLGRTPPFEGATNVEVVMRLLSEEPVPLSRRDPSIPRDVQTIVMKCLEKDPARRYDSARALAEDLGRYLDGEPIEARPSGIHYRLYKRARKNKALVATAGVGIVLVVAFAALGLRARATARRQAELAAEFARTVEDVEWLMRVAHMAPLHDVRPEKARVGERLVRIEERMRTAGSLALGPGEYALGRGQLVLGDPVAARRHLEAAWAGGYRQPQVAYALGLALGELYRRELELADSIGARELRESKRRELQAAYRDPAVAFLRQAAGTDVAAPEYVEGLLAFYERRFPEALAQAEAAGRRVPWLYEARLLEGDIQAVRSREAHETGDEKGSAQAIDAAEAAYRAAAEIARSDPAAFEGLCQMGLQRMEAALWARSDLTPLHDAAPKGCEVALSADPDRAEAHAKLANIHRFWANHLLLQGQEPFAALDRAAEHARRAAALDPRNRRAWGNLGVIYRLRAAYEGDHGQDPAESLRLAFEGLQKAVELSGGDAASLNDLGNAYLTRAEDGAIQDPRPDIDEAVGLYGRAIERVPDFAYAHANRAQAFLDRAAFEIEHGIDPSPSLRDARRSVERAVALLPKAEGVHLLAAQASELEARNALLRAEDPMAFLEAGRRSIEAAARINPRPGPDALLVAGSLDVAEARQRASQRLSPEPALARAMAGFRKAVQGDPKLADAWAALAEAGRHLVAWKLSRGERAEEPLAEGLRAAERAIALRPALPRALREKQALLELQEQAAPHGPKLDAGAGRR